MYRYKLASLSHPTCLNPRLYKQRSREQNPISACANINWLSMSLFLLWGLLGQINNAPMSRKYILEGTGTTKRVQIPGYSLKRVRPHTVEYDDFTLGLRNSGGAVQQPGNLAQPQEWFYTYPVLSEKTHPLT